MVKVACAVTWQQIFQIPLAKLYSSCEITSSHDNAIKCLSGLHQFTECCQRKLQNVNF
jgi:hypothetical protein